MARTAKNGKPARSRSTDGSTRGSTSAAPTRDISRTRPQLMTWCRTRFNSIRPRSTSSTFRTRCRRSTLTGIDTGVNVSSSNKGHFANAPAAYDVVPNSVQLDQAALYIEHVPDTVQTEHFDWDRHGGQRQQLQQGTFRERARSL